MPELGTQAKRRPRRNGPAALRDPLDGLRTVRRDTPPASRAVVKATRGVMTQRVNPPRGRLRAAAAGIENC
jgi:hypothetical protein